MRANSVLTNVYRGVRRRVQTWACRYPARVACNVCGWAGRAFVHDSWHPGTVCPNCRSQVRHRLFAACLESVSGLSREHLFAGKAVLHFAPEPAVADLIMGHAGRYTTADLSREGLELRIDICDMGQVPDGAFDLVVACDVLEHVHEDSMALREIHRVLAEGGWAVLTVPQKDGLEATYEDPSIRTPRERAEVFGQKDHVRIYGRDFERKVGEYGFEVRAVAAEDFSLEVVRRHVLVPPKPSSHPLATNHRLVFFAQKTVP